MIGRARMTAILAAVLMVFAFMPFLPMTDGAVYADASGTCGTCSWSVVQSGDDVVLTIEPADGDSGVLADWTVDASLEYHPPWYDQRMQITKVDISKGVVKATTCGYMFSYCSDLKTLDLSDLDTSGVTRMDFMFSNCINLKTLDLSDLDTSAVQYMESMFSGCRDLKTLDLSGFDTSNVQSMNNMFASCRSLERIIAGDGWKTDSLLALEENNMFIGCTSITGGNGTTYDQDHTGRTYARVDADGSPGYLTSPEQVLYPLWVGGTQVTMANAGNIPAADPVTKTGTASYDAETNTLTLDGYKCENCSGGSESTYRAVIHYKGTDQFTIELKGESSVKGSGDDMWGCVYTKGPLLIQGDGELKAIDNNRSGESYSISSEGDIKIENTTVTAQGGNATGYSTNSFGIYSIFGDVIINDSTVTATAGDATFISYGIFAGKKAEINSGTVTAAGTAAVGTVRVSRGILTNEGIVIGKDITKVEVTGDSSALWGDVKNSVPGKGWDNIQGTGDGDPINVNTDGGSLSYKKVIFKPGVVDIRITGKTSTVPYTAGEQSVSGHKVEYKVSGDSDWTETAPDGVSVTLKTAGTDEAKGTKADTYTMGLEKGSFDIDPGKYFLGEVIVTDGKLTIEKAPLTVTAKDQTYVYNGKEQGEGDPAYDDPAVIAEKVTVKGLQGSDVLTSLVLTGSAKEIGEYPDMIEITGLAIGEATNNYEITRKNGKLTIGKAGLNITVNGSGAEKVYNGREQSYEGTVTATSSDEAFDASKFSYTGSIKVSGTKEGEYAAALSVDKCVYDDDNYEVKWTIGYPVRLTITPAPEPKNKISGILLAEMTAKGSRGLELTWTKVKGAKGYDIFFVKCGKTAECKKVRTIKGSRKLRWTRTGLKKKTAYKAYVKAWVMKDGRKTYVRTSPTVHAYTSGSKDKYTVAESITIRNKKEVTLKAGKTYRIKAKVNKLDRSKKLMTETHEPKLRYKSTNNKVAMVSKSGKIKARGEGICKIYVYAANGVKNTVAVTVR